MVDADVPQTEVAPVAVFKKRGAKGKANLRKRPATPPPAESDSDNDDYSSSEDEAGQRVKRRRKNAAVTVTSKSGTGSNRDLVAAKFTADRSAPITSANDATKQSNWYDEDAADAMSAKNLLGSTRSLAQGGQEPDGTYKGLANQTSFIQKNPDAPQRKVGPIKAPTNIRTITVTDFAPDVCKDYKQTGFCGFGDNCKFLHSREDYKQGWQLDKEWENVTKGKKNLGGTVVANANRELAMDDEEEEEAMLENIPFVCIICKDAYKEPVVTRCGHYFCEACALKRYRRDPTCAACGAGTNGVFNGAKRLKRLLERKRERAAKRRQEAIEAGEEVSDEDEEDEA
ncbi:N-terminal methionine N(alpha)-acetyltransferase NatE [Purpureocillium takamizusanense]|uniref:Pre-mRNA-splicing factor CWC24 n=1 Tax=Purpureocillium takamizusanense TaxID=2060973 RepID=A0A9Q8VH47_9HYPO|nr:N-terminal methionine N(alpha)-acetyltransferase NatE [Purpureocillium takamizusanense]UNI24407.1 N-terminal methionine N(alpha)-acetyltransferase NatE [Purpureocillium takamizusanense]